jgi:hypothetical protein
LPAGVLKTQTAKDLSRIGVEFAKFLHPMGSKGLLPRPIISKRILIKYLRILGSALIA